MTPTTSQTQNAAEKSGVPATSWLSRAERVIPSATMTFSKHKGQFPANAPTHLQRGLGSHVWDTEGREYIDYILGLGPIVLGYRYPAVERAVRKQLREGPIFSLSHPSEVLLAEKLVELIPCAQPDGMVKFGKNGSDATAGAVRAARYITGRDVIVSDGYHGWQDWSCPNPAGIPRLTRKTTIAYEEVTERLELAFADPEFAHIAAIIVEPDVMELRSPGTLRHLREICDAAGILLVFDEVLTGFRLDLHGYQSMVGVTPDIACFAKAMSNGYPLSAIVGKREYMRQFENIGYSFTYGGETVSIAASLATIEVMEREPVIPRLWTVGRTLKAAFEEAAREFGVEASIEGHAPRTTVKFAGDIELDPIMGQPPSFPWRTLWAQEMVRRGILAVRGFTACYSHSDEDVERTVEANREVFKVLASVDDPRERLEGEAIGVGIREGGGQLCCDTHLRPAPASRTS